MPDSAHATPAASDTRPGSVIVREAGPDPYAQVISAGGHGMVADEPESVGGQDRGPAPYDLLLAALGTCTSMTLRMYADRLGWPLEGVSVSLHHSRIHARDCADCETDKGMLDRIERTITIEGDDLTTEQREQLLVIADKCPVHRTLTSKVVITTTEVAP